MKLKTLALGLGVLTIGLSLAACNNMNGLGKDVQGGGKALSKAASGKSKNSSSKQTQD